MNTWYSPKPKPKPKPKKTMSSEKNYTENQLKEIFKRLDTNEDGGLGLLELKNALNQVDAKLPVHLAFKALCHADRNRDGNLGEDEIDKLVRFIIDQGYKI